jgi:hypothetical protein
MGRVQAALSGRPAPGSSAVSDEKWFERCRRAGWAIVNVSEKLEAEISGVGSVEYIGDPTIKQDVIGAGRVSKHQ